MFDLSDKDLDCRILGCADGPASFNAELTAAGGRIVSADQIYRFSSDQIEGRIGNIFDTMIQRARENSSAFIWNEITSPQHLGKIRLAAMRRFLDDFPSEWNKDVMMTPPCRSRLGELGFCSAISRVPYEFQRGGNQMLLVERSGEAEPP